MYRRKRAKSGKGTRVKRRRSNFPLIRGMYAGFPDRIRTTLRYSDYLAFDAAATTTGNASWAMNGLFDPYLGAGGHQPLGFDNFMTVYVRYEVISCSVRATVMNAADTDKFCLGILATNTAITPATLPNTLLEYGKDSVFTMVQGTNTVWPLPYVEIKKYIATALGRKKGDDVLTGDVSSNPSNVLAAFVWVGTIDGSDPSAKGIHVMLEYDVEFSNVKQNASAN